MGETIQLQAADGFQLSAYRAAPAGKPTSGLVVVQEIFGVNRHIREVCDRYAEDGFLVIAPALFDRFEPGIELDYTPPEVEKARALKVRTDNDAALRDIEAARAKLAESGSVCLIGYCWGGLLAWLSATRLSGLEAVVSYYGGGIGAVAEEEPHCPVQLHFGENDHAVPLSDVEKVRQAHASGVEIFVYPGAGHGFNCDRRDSHNAEAARLARSRALEFLKSTLGARPDQ